MMYTEKKKTNNVFLPHPTILFPFIYYSLLTPYILSSLNLMQFPSLFQTTTASRHNMFSFRRQCLPPKDTKAFLHGAIQRLPLKQQCQTTPQKRQWIFNELSTFITTHGHCMSFPTTTNTITHFPSHFLLFSYLSSSATTSFRFSIVFILSFSASLIFPPFLILSHSRP